jgi:hypothetical protein
MEGLRCPLFFAVPEFILRQNGLWEPQRAARAILDNLAVSFHACMLDRAKWAFV